jgi:PiT family inorganic phosphate transporter
MTLTTVILIVALIAGFYMAWNIGANDVANAMGTSVGSGALTLTGAVVVAAIFEFGGALLVGSRVTKTVRSGIVDTEVFSSAGQFGADGPLLLMLGMVAALLAAGIWLQLATTYGLPVSTTHSIVGAVVGFGVLAAGISHISWMTVLRIAASWVISPLAGGTLAFVMFVYLRRTILARDDPAERVRKQAPYLAGLVTMMLVLSFIYKGLKNVLHDPAWWMVVAAAIVTAVLAGTAARIAVNHTVRLSPNPYEYVERIFGWLQILTACFVAFAHGANDVANAVGPLAAVVNIAQSGEVSGSVPVPQWILALGGLGIVLGLATWGYKVIATIGREITEMAPSRGFSAEFGAACTVLVFSLLGLPISTTHTLVGAVIGVGLAHGLAALNLRVVRNVVNSWIITLPASAALAAVIFVILRGIFV